MKFFAVILFLSGCASASDIKIMENQLQMYQAQCDAAHERVVLLADRISRAEVDIDYLKGKNEKRECK